MKNTQLLHAWSLRSITSGDGRRLITLWRGAEPESSKPNVAKAFAAAHSKKAAKLSVKFTSEAASGFTPAIQQAPAANKLENPKTLQDL